MVLRRASFPRHGRSRRSLKMLLLEMIALGLVTFAAMLGFIRFCEWV
jgi:hypothetical protein